MVNATQQDNSTQEPKTEGQLVLGKSSVCTDLTAEDPVSQQTPSVLTAEAHLGAASLQAEL